MFLPFLFLYVSLFLFFFSLSFIVHNTLTILLIVMPDYLNCYQFSTLLITYLFFCDCLHKHHITCFHHVVSQQQEFLSICLIIHMLCPMVCISPILLGSPFLHLVCCVLILYLYFVGLCPSFSYSSFYYPLVVPLKLIVMFLEACNHECFSFLCLFWSVICICLSHRFYTCLQDL